MFHTNMGMGKTPLAVKLELICVPCAVCAHASIPSSESWWALGHFFFKLPCFLFPSQIVLRFRSEKLSLPPLGIGYLSDLGQRTGELFPFIFWDEHPHNQGANEDAAWILLDSISSRLHSHCQRAFSRV